jgi:hypothetical protein
MTLGGPLAVHACHGQRHGRELHVGAHMGERNRSSARLAR